MYNTLTVVFYIHFLKFSLMTTYLKIHFYFIKKRKKRKKKTRLNFKKKT